MSHLTKLAIAQSLKNLLQQKPLNKITISEIAEGCGINRMTFYYHFKDIYDLVEWICQEDVRAILKKNSDYTTWQQGLLQIFSAVQENKIFILNVYRCIHQEQLEKFLQPLLDNLALNVIRQNLDGHTVSDTDQAFIARVYTYIFLGAILDWVKEDMQPAPQQIVDRLGILLQNTVGFALDRFQNQSSV